MLSKDLDAPLRWNKKPWVCDECGQPQRLMTYGGHIVCEKCKSHDCTFHKRRVFSLSLGDWLEDEPKSWAEAGPFFDDLEGTGGKVGSNHVPVGGIPVEWLARMLDVIRRCDQLCWILCTKRPENFFTRMKAVIETTENDTDYPNAFCEWVADWFSGIPPKNIILLASIENPEQADKRIPHLLKIPAACRGLSCEPLLSEIRLTACRPFPIYEHKGKPCCAERAGFHKYSGEDGKPNSSGIGWVIAGGESGAKARGCNVDWIRSLRDQSKAAGVPFFCKQLGANVVTDGISVPGQHWPNPHKILCDLHEVGGGLFRRNLMDKSGADASEWPADLRVQQFPNLQEFPTI